MGYLDLVYSRWITNCCVIEKVVADVRLDVVEHV